jgi:hypothetical protein
MRYIIAKKTIIRKEKFGKERFFIYSSASRKLCEISVLGQKILTKFIKPTSIDDVLNKEISEVKKRDEISKFLKKMIDNKYLEKYEQRA